MILRFLRRLHEWCQFVGRVADMHEPTGRVYRISPRTAWDLAEIRHPSPKQQAEADRMVREVIETVRKAHAERTQA